jgi:hypothetical protein
MSYVCQCAPHSNVPVLFAAAGEFLQDRNGILGSPHLLCKIDHALEEVRTARVWLGSLTRHFCSLRRAMMLARRSIVGFVPILGRVVNVRDLRAVILSSIS